MLIIACIQSKYSRKQVKRHEKCRMRKLTHQIKVENVKYQENICTEEDLETEEYMRGFV